MGDGRVGAAAVALNLISAASKVALGMLTGSGIVPAHCKSRIAARFVCLTSGDLLERASGSGILRRLLRCETRGQGGGVRVAAFDSRQPPQVQSSFASCTSAR